MGNMWHRDLLGFVRNVWRNPVLLFMHRTESIRFDKARIILIYIVLLYVVLAIHWESSNSD